jgi:hypothetical protein
MMMNKSKVISSIAILFFALLLMCLAGCGDTTTFTGDGKNVYAPALSKVFFNVTDVTISAPTGTVRQDLTLFVIDKDLLPVGNVHLRVDAMFAFPFNPSLFQFYDAKTNAPLASPFTALTGDYGTYEFYVLIPATISFPTPTTPNSFTTNIDVTSGPATPASLKLTFN